MGTPVSRAGDIGVGICVGHKRTKAIATVFGVGAPTVLTNGIPTCNAIMVGVASCGHPTIVTSMSASVLAEGTGVHRAGDVGVSAAGGPYVVASASPNVLAG